MWMEGKDKVVVEEEVEEMVEVVIVGIELIWRWRWKGRGLRSRRWMRRLRRRQ